MKKKEEFNMVSRIKDDEKVVFSRGRITVSYRLQINYLCGCIFEAPIIKGGKLT